LDEVLANPEPDPAISLAGPLAMALEAQSAEGNAVALLVMRLWKVLLRKGSNRRMRVDSASALSRGGLSPEAMRTVAMALDPRKYTHEVLQEACGVIQNMCFDPENVPSVAGAGPIAPLSALLLEKSLPLSTTCQATAALQSLLYHHEARVLSRDLNLPRLLCGVLKDLVAALRTSSEGQDPIEAYLEAEDGLGMLHLGRVAGSIHNLSCDPFAVQALRDCGLVGLLPPLLQVPSVALHQSVAGIVQNLVRDPSAREGVLHSRPLVKGLVSFLESASAELQGAAVSALVNLMCPLRSSRPSSPTGRPDLLRADQIRLLTNCVVASSLARSLIVSDSAGVAECLTCSGRSIVDIYDDDGELTLFE
jgi:hypothetical protein